MKNDYLSTGYVYGLINPINNKIFYVGKTVNKVKYRIKNHIKGNSVIGCVNKKKMKIINEIMSNGYEVQYIILNEIQSYNLDLDLKNAEAKEINKYWKTITNIHKHQIINEKKR